MKSVGSLKYEKFSRTSCTGWGSDCDVVYAFPVDQNGRLQALPLLVTSLPELGPEPATFNVVTSRQARRLRNADRSVTRSFKTSRFSISDHFPERKFHLSLI